MHTRVVLSRLGAGGYNLQLETQSFVALRNLDRKRRHSDHLSVRRLQTHERIFPLKCVSSFSCIFLKTVRESEGSTTKALFPMI